MRLWTVASARLCWSVVVSVGLVLSASRLEAQTPLVVTPPSITVTGGPACGATSQDVPVSITLPSVGTFDKVDVFLLFDDTGSFAGFVPTVREIFSSLVGALETALPGVEFGFGVGRFEDYGGPAGGFSSESPSGRPFILNQPIVTAATAGGSAMRDTLITAALANSAPGFGGDGPESAIAEALFQVATGLGFDGDGNASPLDSGTACSLATQTSPGTSGDVPPFSSCAVLPTSGTLGGAGFRSGALHLVLLATDVCPVSTFASGEPVPAAITGAGGAVEPTSALSCSGTPGVSRFGFVSNAKSLAGNTVAGAIAPAGAATVQATVSALNALGIRVLGMGPDAAPTTAPGPSFDESVWLSALARLTGAVDGSGTPLVFSTSVPLATLADAIVAAIATTTTEPVDITLDHTALPTGLSFAFAPLQVENVGPGETAAFTVTLTGAGSSLSGGFDIQFKDVHSGAEMGSLPASVACTGPTCNGLAATVYVGDDGIIVGGNRSGQRYRGALDGTSGDDVIRGTDRSDLIKGLDGDDVICGEAGDDRIEGGPGDDWIDGGPGNDLIKGQQGHDALYGGDGDDRILGGPGDDALDGGPGINSLNGEAGSDSCINGSRLLSC